jgi:NADH:ubiquinone oxidoreductase subunit H
MSEFFLILIVSIILLCLFVVLTERKLLAHVQRRFGPSIAGRNGWLQIIVDLIKLASKEFFILPRAGSILIPMYISIFYAIQLLFIQNFIFGPSMFIFDQIDGLIFYHLILVMLSNVVLIIIGFLSQSKYSIIGVVRGIVHVVSVDVFITIIYVIIILSSQSGNFHDFVITQYNYWFLFIYSPLAFGFLIIMLVEAKRAPFDHVETEAEVVAGYATEHSAVFLLVFYLAEYMHLIISANHFSIFFLGGWSVNFFKSIVPQIFLSYTDVSHWFSVF